MTVEKKHEPLISVVIPIYNVESYLEKCVRSVIEQTYTNLQIILVNDGSTDSSPKIAEFLAAEDSRIELFTTANHGLSAARNHGMKHAKGKYITFIDSDDYVTSDYVQFLFMLIADTDFTAQMAICSLYNVYPNGRIENMGDESRRVLSGKTCIEKMCYHELVDTCACAKLCALEMYDNVQFPEGKLFEDIATTYRLFDQCKQVACGFSPKYYYGLRSDSIVNSHFSPAKLDLLSMTDQMATYVESKYPDLSAAVMRRRIYSRFSTLNQMLDLDYNDSQMKLERKQIISFIKRNGLSIIRNVRTPRRDKMALLLLYAGFPVYRFGWNQYVSRKKEK